MANPQFIFIVSVFGVVSTLTWLVSQWMLQRTDGRLRDRLRSGGPAPVHGGALSGKVSSLFARIGNAAAKAFEPKTREKQSELRKRLARAGIYAGSSVRLVVGAKAIFLVLGLLGGYTLGLGMGNLMLGVSVGGLVGYLLPAFWLKHRIKAQQHALDRGLADTIDLLVVCVEAGLTIDSALQRVGQEIAIAHPALSRELDITHMETRVGLARADALKNLGQRTGNPGLQSLAAMLIQAERFGTSIAQALRIHADSLRTARQHAAEEIAAKTTVKLSFPVVLFIFPAVLIVLAGPAAIGLLKSALMNN
jgi:tight adherence protein C